MANPNEAICHYCGEKLPHEKCSEARKKPDPGEFTKLILAELDDGAKFVSPQPMREACNIIDRLTAELKTKDKRIEELTDDLTDLEWI